MEGKTRATTDSPTTEPVLSVDELKEQVVSQRPLVIVRELVHFLVVNSSLPLAI